MEIVILPMERLKPYEKNPRKNDHAVEQVAAAIRQFGFRVPILVRNGGEIVDGHLRYKAAQFLGLSEVPVMSADDMSEEQIKAFRISINKVSELAKWDIALLKEEIESLKSYDFDVLLTGFSESEIDDMFGGSGGSGDDDHIPDVREEYISRPGDIWILGNHRLACGDSLDQETYRSLLGGGISDMVFTDPPYNVDYQGKAGKIKNDKMSDKKFYDFLLSAFSLIFANIVPGGPIYVAHADAGNIGVAFRTAFLNAGFKLASCLVWRKNAFVIGRGDYHWQHEPILYGWRPGKAHRWFGGRKKTTIQDSSWVNDAVTVLENGAVQVQIGDNVFLLSGSDMHIEMLPSTVINEEKPLKSELHPTMKPVSLVERFIINSSCRGDVVLDPFGGSGSTLIACEKLGRKCRTIELDPRFADVIIRRWQDYSGEDAVHADDGSTFRERGESLA